MINLSSFEQIQSLLKEGMTLAKCKKCKCMKDAFVLNDSLQLPSEIQKIFKHYEPQLEPIQYT